jgi:hypothetical protein
MLVGVARVDRAARVELRTIDEVHGRASRQPRVEHREHVVVRPQVERQALEALDGLGSDARAADGRVARGEEPHLVTGAVQVAGECPRHVREPPGLGERLDLGGEQADGEILLHLALLRRMPVSLPDACQAIECLVDHRAPVRMPDACQVMM